MAATHSNRMPLGTIAPDFDCFDTMTGSNKTLHQLKGDKGTVVLFICNHCPYVLHVKDQLIDIAEHYAAQGIHAIAISSNDIERFPQDGPDKMKAMMEQWGYPFSAYLYDDSQAVAKAYQAACTPDIYLFDADLVCIYHGRLDGATPKNDVPSTGEDLRNALDNLLAGIPIAERQIPSTGCNIKWKQT